MKPFRKRAVALAVLSIAAAGAFAEEPVYVSASRFESRAPAATNLRVISREVIQASQALSVPELLASQGGIVVSPMYGALGIDATVDVRGFGESATSNTLILVDGVRYNPVDSGSIVWSAIPVASIERIEIQRGSGTVLYGDRASGGVINIVTKKPEAGTGSVAATLGSYGYRAVDGSAGFGNDKGFFSLIAHTATSDGWRKNNQQDQSAVTARGGVYLPGGELALSVGGFTESNGMPGQLYSKEYLENPRQASTPLNTQKRDGFHIQPSIRLQVSDAVAFESEYRYAKSTTEGNFVSWGSVLHRELETQALTPRIRLSHTLGGLKSETVTGLDIYHSTVDATSTTGPRQAAEQNSSAVYLQNTTHLTDELSAIVGLRSQRMEQSASQAATKFKVAMADSTTRTQTAYDVGLSYDQPGWRVYGKVGTTFRFANTDELFGYDFSNYQPVFAGNLKPQHGTIAEVGGGATLGVVQLRGSLFRMELRDELGYDSAVGPMGANVNLDPTRRQGVEAEAAWAITSALGARLAYSYTEAEYREGPYAGHAVTLVPRHKGSAQLTWNTGAMGQYTATINAVGAQRASGDRLGEVSQVPGYATLDVGATWNLKPFKVSAKVANVFDKRYSSYVGYANWTTPGDKFYYPADGRSAFVTVGYDF